MNGGYALINAKGLDLNNLGKVDGIYNEILNAVNNNKTIVLCGVVNGAQAFSPITAYGGTEEAGVFVSFGTTTLHVTSGDVVSM